MNRILQTVLLTILSFGFSMAHASIPISNSLAPMLQKALPAVVNIKAQFNNTLGDKLEKKQQQEGNNNPSDADKVLSIASGVIVDPQKGYILTNAHAVDDAQSVTVTLSDGRHFNAKLIGLDKPSDIAVLQIQAKNLTGIPMSDSNQLKVGDIVAAIGNPFGLSQSVTSGIVSALGRTTLGIENYENFIQTDAPINPGNSGGALINTEGQLVGINTAILAPDRGSIGIGFAIPSNMAKSIMQQLIEYGNVRRGALGVAAQDITPELAEAFNLSTNMKGAAVALVVPNSPAQKAGLQVGDVITSVNGAEVKNANDVVNAIAFLRVDSKATIVILRNNKSITLTTNILDPKKRKEVSEHANPFLYGVGLKNFTLLSPVHGDVKGVLIVTVDEDSNAWQSGLMQGDVITSANQIKIANIDDLQKVAGSAKHTLLVNVLRGSGAIFLVINKDQ
jgi:serine protease Do